MSVAESILVVSFQKEDLQVPRTAEIADPNRSSLESLEVLARME